MAQTLIIKVIQSPLNTSQMHLLMLTLKLMRRGYKMLNNKYVQEILKAMQSLEEISGPEESEYLAVLSYLKNDIETRLTNCIKKNEIVDTEKTSLECFEHRIDLDYVDEVMQRTGWNKETVLRVLHGLDSNLFTPSDRQHYLEKISPF
jgi:hypothetical protein